MSKKIKTNTQLIMYERQTSLQNKGKKYVEKTWSHLNKKICKSI